MEVRKRRKGRDINEHTMTGAEIIDDIHKNEQKKRHQKRRPHVFHFFPVTHGRIVYQGSGLRTQLDYPRNGLTLRYLFLCFVTRGVLQSLILEHWKVHDPQGKKHITHQDLLEMMAVKVWLHSTPTKYHDDCWPFPTFHNVT